jgi:two-component system response regulator HydG
VRDLPTVIHSAPDASDLGHDQARKVIPMADLERLTILNTITELNGDKLLAARLLGIGKTTLYRKLKEYGAQL